MLKSNKRDRGKGARDRQTEGDTASVKLHWLVRNALEAVVAMGPGDSV